MPRGVGLDRGKVIEIAGRIADEHGADALTLARLAEVAGVRVPSLYKHVDGLPDVQAALAIEAYQALDEALRRVSSESPDTALRLAASAWRRWALTHPGRWALSTRSHLAGRPEVREAGEPLLAAVLDLVGALGPCADDRVHAARAVRALVHGFVGLELAGGFGLSVDVQASFDTALDALIKGLGEPPVSRDADPASGR
jgi:AcrR family transcriptional regulator